MVTFNLPLLDIHRGRDHGVSDYNQLRAGLGLSTYGSFEEFASANGLDQERLDQLKSVYSDISEMDSIVGGLLEAKVPGSQLGESFTLLNVMQFEATRNGDPFFYLNRFKDSPEIIEQVKNTSMNDILLRSGIIDKDFGHAFQAPNRVEGTDANDILYGTTSDDLILGRNGDDGAFGGLGDDVILGAAGDDWLFGQGGNDYIHGGSGNDFIFGRAGSDRLTGGSGFDYLTGGAGDDIFVFFAGSDTNVVTEFTRGDKINLSSFGFSSFDELESYFTFTWNSIEINIGSDKLTLERLSAITELDVII